MIIKDIFFALEWAPDHALQLETYLFYFHRTSLNSYIKEQEI